MDVNSKLFLCILAVLFPTTIYTLQKPIHEYEVHSSVANCALEISLTYFPYDSVLLYSTSLGSYNNSKMSSVSRTSNRLLLQQLHRQGYWNILVKVMNEKNYYNSKFIESANCYILLVSSEIELDNNLFHLRNTSSWNAHAKFIIIIYESEKWENFLTSSVETLWQFYVINFVLLVQKQFKPRVHIFIWLPYENNDCGTNFNNIQEIDSCDFGKFKKNTVLFPEKIPRNMHGCPLRVITVIWPPYVLSSNDKIVNDESEIDLRNGYEVLLIKVLAHKMNLTVKFYSFEQPENFGYIYSNGTSTGLIKKLILRESDVGIGAMYPSEIRHKYLDHSVPYLQDMIAWTVPISKPVSKWMNYLVLMTPRTMISCVVVIAIACLLVYLLSKNKPEPPLFRSISSSLIAVLAIALFNNTCIEPRFCILRSFMLIWVFYSIHVGVLFQTALMHSFSSPLMEPQLNNAKDLIKSGLVYSFKEQTLVYFKYYNVSEDKAFTERYEFCKTIYPCLMRVANGRDRAIAVSRSYLDYTQDLYRDLDGNSKVFTFTENIITLPIEMLMVKGFPLKHRFNELILNCKSAGLFEFWASSVLRKSDQTKKADLDKEERKPAFQLRMKHLFGAFFVLAVGLVLATVIFILEISYYRSNFKRLFL